MWRRHETGLELGGIRMPRRKTKRPSGANLERSFRGSRPPGPGSSTLTTVLEEGASGLGPGRYDLSR